MLPQKKYPFFILTVSVVLGTMVLSGCSGNNRQALSGTVTLDGEPLSGAVINFQPKAADSGVTSGAATDDEGKFSIARDKGLLPGEYTVSIQKWIKTGRTLRDGQTGEIIEVTAPVQFKESGNLAITVASGGANQHDFHLTSAR